VSVHQKLKLTAKKSSKPVHLDPCYLAIMETNHVQLLSDLFRIFSYIRARKLFLPPPVCFSVLCRYSLCRSWYLLPVYISDNIGSHTPVSSTWLSDSCPLYFLSDSTHTILKIVHNSELTLSCIDTPLLHPCDLIRI
jgi:hypothetical protein